MKIVFAKHYWVISSLILVSANLALAATSVSSSGTLDGAESYQTFEPHSELRPPFDHLFDLIEQQGALDPSPQGLLPYDCELDRNSKKKLSLVEGYFQSIHQYHIKWSKWLVQHRYHDGTVETFYCVVKDDEGNHEIELGVWNGQALTLEEAIVLEAASSFTFDNSLGPPEDPDFCIDRSALMQSNEGPSILRSATGDVLGTATECPPTSQSAAVDGLSIEKFRQFYLEPNSSLWPQRFALASDAYGRREDGGPYHVKCSAYQIHAHAVLGSAHCFAGLQDATLTSVEMQSPRFGWFPRLVDRPSDDIFIPPDFVISGESQRGDVSAALDLAVIRFREPLPVSFSLPRLTATTTLHTVAVTAHGFPVFNCEGVPPLRQMCTGHADATRRFFTSLDTIPGMAGQLPAIYDAFTYDEYLAVIPGMSGSSALRGGYPVAPTADIVGVLSNRAANKIYMASVPDNFAFLVGAVDWSPPRSFSIVIPNHFQRFSVLSPPLFQAQASLGFRHRPLGDDEKYVWLSSRGNVLGEGQEVDVSGRLRAGAQEVWLTVLPIDFDFFDDEEVVSSEILDQAIDYRLRVIDVTGPWGRLEFPGFGVCIRDIGAGSCDLRVRWSTSGASGVEIRDGGDTPIGTGANGDAVLSFAGNSNAQANLRDGSGRLLDRKTTSIVNPSGSINSRNPGCEVLPSTFYPNATTCEMRLDWGTEYAPGATIWRVGVQPVADPILVHSQPSGNDVRDPVEQGRVVRYELRQKSDYSSGLLDSTDDVYAVRYADAYEFDDGAFRRGPTYSGPLTRNFHLAADVDWVRVPGNLAVPAVDVTVTGATAQVRPRVIAHYICAGPSFPEPDHMGLLLAGFDMTALGQSLHATIPVDASACGAFFGANHGFAQLALEIRNVLATDCGRSYPPPTQPCGSHFYTVEVETAAAYGQDSYEPDDSLDLATEMPDFHCFPAGTPHYQPGLQRNSFSVKNHTIHALTDVDWTVGYFEDIAPHIGLGPFEFDRWRNLFVRNFGENAQLELDVWSASGGSPVRPEDLSIQALLGSISIDPGQTVRVNEFIELPRTGVFAISVRAMEGQSWGSSFRYDVFKKRILDCSGGNGNGDGGNVAAEALD